MIGSQFVSCGDKKSFIKKVREKSRECHNHKPQPFPDPKRKRKPTNLNKHKPNKRTKSTKISSLFPKTPLYALLSWAGWPSGFCTRFYAGYRGFESRSGRDNFQTISTPSSYSTCPGLNIKWTGRRLVTDSGTKCAWVNH